MTELEDTNDRVLNTEMLKLLTDTVGYLQITSKETILKQVFSQRLIARHLEEADNSPDGRRNKCLRGIEMEISGRVVEENRWTDNGQRLSHCLITDVINTIQ